jgi:uncharacterized SAM-binding protein YcdF (DUF218 family)
LRPGAKAAVRVLMVAALAWFGGFGWFVHAARQAGAPPPQADGVVALTGGVGRIEAALRLLAEGRGAVLLISGVGPASELADIVRRAGLDPAAVAGEITLGRVATTTMGNADETAQWARARNVRTLIVVTAGYHMARAMTELGRALPGVTLIPNPVLPPATQMWQSGTIRLLMSEYMKFLIASAGFSRLFPIAHPSL